MEYQKNIGNKIVDRITKVSKNSQQNNSKAFSSENERQQIIMMEYQLIMEYQNMLENVPNEPTKFMTKKWLKYMINYMECTTLVVKLILKL